MAIIGGAGNPVGGSFTGPAQALEVIGDHAYAYNSGTSTGNNAADLSMLKFTTGNYYMVADLDYADEQVGGDKRLLKVTMNGATVWTSNFDDSPPGLGTPVVQFIIPAYTEFEAFYGMNGATTIGTYCLTGRIYRG